MFEDDITFAWTGVICLVATGLSLHQVRAVALPRPVVSTREKKRQLNDFSRDPTRRSPPPTLPPAPRPLILIRNRS